jgi:arachidonate 15-lipoxygenase
LFYWQGNQSSGNLIPLAIKIRRDNPVGEGIFTPLGAKYPTTPVNWHLAKAAFQSADAHMHEWDSHVVRTHIALIPFAISSERHLHDDHPILIILRPHLRYLLAINDATDKLLAEGSYGNEVLQPSHQDLMNLLSKNYGEWRFDRHSDLTEDLKYRGMDKNEAPIAYPYRDDGLLIEEVLGDYIAEYIRLYYADDNDVIEDYELQSFIAEVMDPNYGRLENHLIDADTMKIDSIKKLTWLITRIIWTSGPFHAAVNFPQWDYLGDPRNAPLSLYQDIPASGNLPPISSNTVDYFPSRDRAYKQAAIMYVLGTYRYDMLGLYKPKDFLDPAALKVISRFQCRLMQVGMEIAQLDSERTVSYPYLLPWHIPNSTSI